MVAWLAARIRLIVVLAAVLGPFALLNGFWQRSRTNDVLTNGVEATAIIESGSRSWSSRGGEQFKLTLAWTDAKGQKHTVENHWISSDFAAKIVAATQQPGGIDGGAKPAWALRRSSVRIRYTADRPGSPIILEDAAYRHGADNQSINFGITVSLIALVGGGIYFVRRRRQARAV